MATREIAEREEREQRRIRDEDRQAAEV